MATAALAVLTGLGLAQDRPFTKREDLIAVDLGVRAITALRPAYRLVEGISDGVFGGFLSTILRGSPARSLGQDSFAAFTAHYRAKQERMLERLRHEQNWDWAPEGQVQVVLDSLRDTLMDRYQVQRLGAWAKDQPMDAHTLAGAGVIGGAFLYFGGGHANARIGQARVGVDLASVQRISSALASGGDLAKAAGVELRWGAARWSLNAGLGVSRGRMAPGSYALRYRLSF